MPIYEYHCFKCDKEFERFQKITDTPLATCPDCNGSVRRLISQTSFSLKGSGWYSDGYTRGKPTAEPAKEKKPEQKTEAKIEKKETKKEKKD